MSRRLQTGLSMIELMVALLLSTVLVLGLVRIFSASRASYQMAQGLARAQESSRFAIDALQRDARMAGHFGCVSDQAHFFAGKGFGELFLSDRDDYASVPAARGVLRYDYSVRGYEAKSTGPGGTLDLTGALAPGAAGDWEPALATAFLASLTPAPVRGSDILTLRFLSPESAEVTSFAVDTATGASTTISVPTAQWQTVNEGTTKQGLFGIADCRSVVVFQANEIKNVSGGVQVVATKTGVNQSLFDGSDNFAPGQARLYRAENFVYYVGLNSAGQPGLYRARYNVEPGSDAIVLDSGAAEEVVEGVENLQLLFGQDNETDPDKSPTGVVTGFTTAADVLPATASTGAWQRVGGLQVGLLIRSNDPASSPGKTAVQRSLGVELRLPNDERYRNVYETNIALRNRLYGN